MTNTHRFAVVGRNIGYTCSPRIFHAIFAHCGEAGEFGVSDVEETDLAATIERLTLDGVTGLSVTVPYKTSVLKYLHEVDPEARALEAVNSIMLRDRRLIGFNTDHLGFSLPLMPFTAQLEQGRVLVIGCGGAARAIVYSLHKNFEISRVTVVGRQESKLAVFKSHMESQFQGLHITAARFDTLNGLLQTGYDLVVNCTPLAGANHDDMPVFREGVRLDNTSFYYDLNYNENNRMIEAARRHGVTAIDGSMMLVGQAVKSFEIWTGQKVPVMPIHDEVFGSRRSDLYDDKSI
ncbi:MAG: shikimate dehydrogenase [Candidatus Zixiibacteriota bacterium]|nr:MAG: shikimate dehydrogenase [candidate division Zixibacteria bacterium]